MFREAYGQAVATLVRVFGDIDLAEDAVQDALAVATDRWLREGLPPNPPAWIVTTARNRAIDLVRRDARGRQLSEEIARAGPPDSRLAEEVSAVGDDRLRLIFTCCHPALRQEHQMALTLRLLGGLSVEELARAFLVSQAAMAKRLVRAKYKIRAANIPYRVPREANLPERLQVVLSVLYLIYNAGIDRPDRAALRVEAIRLARTLWEMMPNEPEAAGLLALMLLSEARAAARHSADSLVLLRDQDRTKWSSKLIAEGQAIVRACIRRDRPGPYQLQAAIQAVHCSATSFKTTDWHQIVELYDHLYALLPTPVVALNRAIAVAEVSGPDAALSLIDGVAADLSNYHLMHAARGALLERLGCEAEAHTAYERALHLAATSAECRFLAERIKALTDAAPNVDTQKGPG